MERIAGKNGWFVPVTTLLDYLAVQRGETNITDGQSVERGWLMSKFRVGQS